MYVLCVSDSVGRCRGLEVSVTQLLKHAYAPGTRKNYRSCWRSFVEFALHYDLPYLPTTSRVLCFYIAWLHRLERSPTTIANQLSALKCIHMCNDKDTSIFELSVVKLLLRAVGRDTGHVIHQKLPITPEILNQIYHVVDFDVPDQYATWCAILLGFYSMMRKSNLVVPSLSKWSIDKTLTRDKLVFTEFGLIIHVTWSKVMQNKNSSVQIPISCVHQSVLCPVKWIRRFTAAFPAPPKFPLFTYKTSKSLIPLTYHKFTSNLKLFLSKIGLNPSNFSGHSLRRGGASFLCNNSFSERDIQLLGDWSSSSVQRYMHTKYENRQKLAKKFALLVQKD